MDEVIEVFARPTGRAAPCDSAFFIIQRSRA
jgi:hypothetical protein